ncbi:hypothetical protein [Streptomyces boncukensis]|uniref:Uncharacterized protein n=1 Tax=Streptomyces boncukensis TaxID=2711219 RepID=A0A6G4WVP4_9ACTN|nr:hypothetical protein [Streptomyces boncukensis]NGO68541.1 hypothetical protein [Streptomyces boncukensis]
MLEIGLQGLSLVLTVVVVAAARKGGQTIPSTGGLAAGAALAYCYARTGRPWSILAEKGKDVVDNAGTQFSVVPAAVALALLGWWHYTRPRLVASTVLGFLMMTAAAASSGLWREISGIIGSFVKILAG